MTEVTFEVLHRSVNGFELSLSQYESPRRLILFDGRAFPRHWSRYELRKAPGKWLDDIMLLLVTHSSFRIDLTRREIRKVW